MTGRGMGFCAGYPAPGFATPGPGLGRGFGRGFGGGGRGWRNMHCATGLPGWMRAGYAPPPPAAPPKYDEAAALRQQAEYLEESLEQIKARLANLEKQES